MRWSLSLLLLSAATLGGCYVNNINTGLPPGGAKHTEQVSFFLWGLAGDASFDLAQLCPQGVSKIHEEQDVNDVVLSCVTCGLYSPRTVTITCAGGGAWLMQEDVSAGGTWITQLDEEAQ